MTGATVRRGDAYKSRWAWLGLAVVLVLALTIGVARAGGVRSPEARIDAIAKTVKCPVCPGESVYESRNSVALNIKNEIARQVRAGQTDGEIRAALFASFPGTSLVPSGRGIDSLVWILPVVALALGVAGLAFAFRRWRADAAAAGTPSDADRELVEDALRGGDP